MCTYFAILSTCLSKKINIATNFKVNKKKTFSNFIKYKKTAGSLIIKKLLAVLLCGEKL